MQVFLPRDARPIVRLSAGCCGGTPRAPQDSSGCFGGRRPSRGDVQEAEKETEEPYPAPLNTASQNGAAVASRICRTNEQWCLVALPLPYAASRAGSITDKLVKKGYKKKKRRKRT